MTQRNRPAIHVDITRPEPITTIKVSKPTWDPNAGARSIARAEAAAVAQHKHEQMLAEQDPVIIRMNEIDSKLNAVLKRLDQLEKA